MGLLRKSNCRGRLAAELGVSFWEKLLNYELSDKIKLVLEDGDVVWPTTMDGSFRLITKGEGHNILGEGEHQVSEAEMINGVLNNGMPSRWRSKIIQQEKSESFFNYKPFGQ